MLTVDTPLSQRVDTAISGSPYLSGKQLRFEADAGKVVLRGVVSSFFQKQMAQEAIRRVDGVREIENHLEVQWS